MSRVLEVIDEIIEREGGDRYTDLPADSGGPTRFGITLETLGRWRGQSVTADDVKSLQRNEAVQILLYRFWYGPGFDTLLPISPPVADELLDTGVNMGPATAVKFLQTVLTTFNNRGRQYHDIEIDGRLGQQTRAALIAFLSFRKDDGLRVLLFSLNSLQVADYIGIARRREKDEEFVYGQILHRAANQWRLAESTR